MYKCLELYSLRGDGTKLDPELLIKSFINLCRNSELELVTLVNKQRVSTLIRIRGDDNCLKSFIAFLKAIIPEDVGISEVNCSNPFEV